MDTNQPDNSGKFFFIGLVIAFCLATMLFSSGVNLGIDLKGGAELVYTIRNEGGQDISNLMDKALQVISKRIDPLGSKDYRVAPSNDRILISMGGATQAEIARVKDLLNTAGTLEMRLEVRKGGYRSSDYDVAVDALQAGKEPPKGLHWYSTPRGQILVEDEKRITGNMLASAEAHQSSESTDWIVSLKFSSTSGGVEALRQISKTAFNNNRSGMAIIQNDIWNADHTVLLSQGTCDSSPSVNGEFTTGECIIEGGYSPEDAKNLATILNSGSLPFSVVPESAIIVGPSLGEKGIRNGLMSCLIGSLLVYVFAVAYYGRLGVIACLCLTLNLLMVYAGMSFFGFVLTLPGIAGIVLTVGMAVDANILIFERIKEELRSGSNMGKAIDAGFDKAFGTIFDSNLTTLITGIILYTIGSGPVKGFAVTLCMGIITSMYTAVYVGRTLTDWLYARNGLKVNQSVVYRGNFPFMGATATICILLSTLICASSLWGIYSSGKDCLGIDFVGGSRIHVAFRDRMSVEAVREGLDKALSSPEFTFNDGQVIAVQSEGDEGSVGTREFILRTKNQNNEAVEAAFKMVFAEALQADPFRDDESSTPLSFVEFAISTARAVDAESFKGRVANEFKDTHPIVSTLPSDDADMSRWRIMLPFGLADNEALQARLEGALSDIIVHDNVRFLPGEKRKVTLVLASQVSAEDLKRDIALLDPSYSSVTVEMAPDVPGKPLRAVVTFPQDSDLHSFARKVVDTGYVALTQLGEPRAVPNMFHIWVNAISTGGLKSIDEKLTKAGIQLLDAKGSGEQFELHVGMEGVQGGIDGLKAKVSDTLHNDLTSPIVANTNIRASIAGEMTSQALWSLFWSLVSIVIYVWYRFEFRFGIAAIIALAHDVAVMLGVIAYMGIEIDLTVIGAILTIVGYSINDTIVIFDRIRENTNMDSHTPYKDLLNLSVNQTFSRSLLTSLTVMLVVSVLYFMGGDELKPFSTVLLAGLFSGSYSTIFVASPILYIFQGGKRSRDRQLAIQTQGA
ncbi:MAG: protein translocase subunit SecD [Planctomycetota bacterium]